MNGIVDVYYGAASGQQRAALRRLEPENVMISHATENNTPFEGDYSLMVDSGGYHHMNAGTGEYESSDEEYIGYLRDVGPDVWVYRDYPCEPGLLDELGRTVAGQMHRTVRHHDRLDAKIDDNLRRDGMVVLQGWTTEEYLDCLDRFRDRGLPMHTVGIGSVCRRGQDREIADIILAIRDELDDKTHLHAFGVKGSVLRFKEVCEALDSADSGAYDYKLGRFGSGASTWRDSARYYLNWRNRLSERIGTESLTDPRQTQLKV